jgi:hypothetical protein
MPLGRTTSPIAPRAHQADRRFASHLQLKALLHFYFNLSGDPMMRGVFGLTGHESEWTWFR